MSITEPSYILPQIHWNTFFKNLSFFFFFLGEKDQDGRIRHGAHLLPQTPKKKPYIE